MRFIISSLLRLSEKPSHIYVMLAVCGLLIGFIKDEYEIYIGASNALWFSRAAFVIGIGSLLPMMVKDLNLWRFVSPKYHGLDPLLVRLDPKDEFDGVAFFGTDGIVRLDCRLALEKLRPTADCMVFVGCDKALAEESGNINASAFSGTKFGLAAASKTQRNLAISSRNPLTFALLKQDGQSVALASTIPLTEIASTLYLQGTLSDNDVGADSVARCGAPVGSIVLFLVAHNKSADTYGQAGPAVLRELMRACLIQIALIASVTPSQTKFHIVAANSNPNMQKLFKGIGLFHHTAYRNADGQDVFAADIRVRHVLSEAEIRSIPGLAPCFDTVLSKEDAA